MPYSTVWFLQNMHVILLIYESVIWGIWKFVTLFVFLDMVDNQKGEKVNSVNSSTKSSQGCLNHLEMLKHAMHEDMNEPLAIHEEAISYSSKNPTNMNGPSTLHEEAISYTNKSPAKVSMPCNESKEIGNTVFDILSRLKKPSQEDVSY